MKVYVDLILFLNFGMDVLLLLSVSFILRRNVSINRILCGAFLGSFSVLFLFYPFTSFQLFLLKCLLSFFMTITTFGYKNMRYTIKNIIFLYLSGMILGGFFYFLNLQFSTHYQGFVFYQNGYSINYLLLSILGPIFIYFYVKQSLHLKNHYSSYYQVELYIQNKKIRCNAFLDSGNKLVDPITKRPVILVEKKLLKGVEIDKFFFVPYHTIDRSGMIKCIKPDKMIIRNVGKKEKFLVGILDTNIKMDGIDCILHSKILEG